MIGAAWRRPNRRTLVKGTLAARTDWANGHGNGTAENPAGRDIAPFIAAELGVEVDAVAMLLSEYVYRQLRELGEPQPDFMDR